MKIGDVIKIREDNTFGTIIAEETMSPPAPNDIAIKLYRIMSNARSIWYLKEHLELISSVIKDESR